MKKILLLLMCCLLPICQAFALEADGVTACLDSSLVSVLSEASGTLENLSVQAGDMVEKGQSIGNIKAEKVFATCDGTVLHVDAQEGQYLNDTALQITPACRYIVYFTAEKSTQTAEMCQIHIGETVYMRCTKDATHLAIGYVTRIDGSYYKVETTAGELYVGETVYAYRDPSYDTNQRVGKGTVTMPDADSYQAAGRVLKMYVQEGDYVRKGQLLFTYVKGQNDDVTAAESGIVVSVSGQTGQNVNEGEILAQILPANAICVEATVSEEKAASLRRGQKATIQFAYDQYDKVYSGTVSYIASDSSDDTRLIRITLEDPLPYVGLTCHITIAE